MSYVRYQSRPDSGPSMNAWDYFTEKFGRFKELTLCAPCSNTGSSFWMININGNIETVTPVEIRGFVANREKK
jgi:hypothetical protein